MEIFMMVEHTELAVALRPTIGNANKRLRRQGWIPGNITGHNQESQPVQVAALAFDTLRRNHAATSLIRLIMPDASAQTVLIRHVQHAPASEKVLHIDFSRASVSERITAKVPLRYVGESLSVKNKSGVLLHLLDRLDVECPASAIADYLEVDISALTEIDATLHACDVTLPANYTLMTLQGESIAKIVARNSGGTEETATPASADAEPGRPEMKGESNRSV
jgi:large subunit ribosomal protein L25